ncbi:MAG: hypothetical protein ACQKBW_00780, partial [Puniceicoccales bacterium]
MNHSEGAEPDRNKLLRLFCMGAALLFTVLLAVIAFPPFDVAEAAYVLAVPLLLWASSRPRWRTYLLGAWGAGVVSWFILLIWLRHMEPPMGWVALVILSGIMSGFNLVWYAAARWLFPRAVALSTRPRVIALLGLAGGWVVMEWVRSWMFFGFPWATLAASQWQRPPVLTVAAWTGAYGVSFILNFFNLALAAYAGRLGHPVRETEDDDTAEAEDPPPQPAQAGGGVSTQKNSSPDAAESLASRTDDEDDDEELREKERPYRSLGRSLMHTRPQRSASSALSLSGAFSLARSPGGGFARFLRLSPELMLALAMLLGSLWLFFKTLPHAGEMAPLFKAGVVQPWTDPNKKWDSQYFRENLMTLSSLTERVVVSDPDLIIWPEAATPGPLLDPRDPRMQAWVEQVVNSAGRPLLSGNLA